VGTQHPSLDIDLLGEQIGALHAVGIRAPIYVSVLWDDLAGELHPEWIITTLEGRSLMRRPLSHDSPGEGTVGWTTLDVSGGYGDYLAALVEELLDRYSVDGFWFDIVWPQPNFSALGQKLMREQGIRLDDAAQVQEFAARQMRAFMKRMNTLIRARYEDASIFFNCTINPEMRDSVPFMSHLEIESLPTSGDQWGYTHYPVVSRFARTFGLEILGMTGRFHKSWGDFGGLKTIDQLMYECGTILSSGGGISVGDQLDPSGRLDPAVYRTIGAVFNYVAQIEPWLLDSRPTAEVAILGSSVKEMRIEHLVSKHDLEVEGMSQVFLETGIQFDIVDSQQNDLTGYAALVIPESLNINPELLERIQRRRQEGVKVILSGTAAMDDNGDYLLPDMPVEYVGPTPTVPSYLRPDGAQAVHPEVATDYDYAFYDQAHVVKALAGATGHGEIRSARYNRSWEHFTSHAQAPVGAGLGSPIVAHNDDVLYFAAPLFRAYRNHDYWVYRELITAALDQFLPQRLVRLEGPGWVETTMHTQAASGQRPARDVVHLTTYQARRATNGAIAHVDEAAAVAGLRLHVAVSDREVTKVYLAPSGQDLRFTQIDGVVIAELPPIGRHSLVIVE